MGKRLLASLVICAATSASAQAPSGGAAIESPAAAPSAARDQRGSRLAAGGAPKARYPARASVGPAGPAMRLALGREIHRQVRPHWQAPSAAGSGQLRTTVTVSLSASGQIAEIGEIETTGDAAGRRRLVDDHQQRAIRAIRLAAPFRLPADYYDAWKVIRLTFDKRLSQ